ncbi:hypothetical protein ACFWIO_35630, partial [Streptomyces diastatochromogenes]
WALGVSQGPRDPRPPPRATDPAPPRAGRPPQNNTQKIPPRAPAGPTHPPRPGIDTSRVDTAQRRFLHDGNLDLDTPLEWRVYGEPYRIP